MLLRYRFQMIVAVVNALELVQAGLGAGAVGGG
jgi:hypothetical protein